MSLYINANNQEIVELDDDLFQAWIEANNPKKDAWILLPQQPPESSYWNGSEWIEPQPTIPSSVSARQIRLWLIRNNIDLSSIDSAINNIPDSQLRDSVRVEWEYAPYIERTHPMLVPIAVSLGLTESDIDRAFIEASII